MRRLSRRLVLLTEIIAPYRIPVFNALAAHEEVNLHVIFLSRTDDSMRHWRVYEDEIRFSYQVLPSWRKRLGKYNLLLNQDVSEALRQAAPDVIVCGGYNYLASWQAMAWARRNHVQFLLWSESTGSDHRGNHLVVELLKRKFLQNCAGFIVPGQSAMQYLEKLRVPRKKIFVARNAVDIDLFGMHGKAALKSSERLRAELALPERYFIFVGRLVESKGVFDLLEAYSAIPADVRSEIGLVFAGEGPMRAELETRAREIYPGSICFTGFVHREHLPAYYGLAECLVFPTRSDPWGLVVNEAMACGLPVICTEVAGCAADLVRNSGMLVPAGNAQQLAHAMQRLATDKTMRLSMSRESQEVIRNYSPEICAAGIAEASLGVDIHV